MNNATKSNCSDAHQLELLEVIQQRLGIPENPYADYKAIAQEKIKEFHKKVLESVDRALEASVYKKFFKNNNTRLYSPIKEAAATRDYSPLRETPREYFECLEDSECHDELFLLPEQVLDMDSYVVREDLSAIVPSLRRLSPHNSLDSEDSGSGKSLKLLEDSDGICLARASDDCRTFWLSELITF